MSIWRSGEFVTAVILLLFSVLYLSQIRLLTLGTLDAPKEGFLPLILGALLFLLSCALVVRAWLLKTAEVGQSVDVQKTSIHGVAKAMAGILLFPLVIPYITFEGGLVALAFWLAWLMHTTKRAAVLLAVGTAGVTYVVFRVWLQISLP